MSLRQVIASRLGKDSQGEKGWQAEERRQSSCSRQPLILVRWGAVVHGRRPRC